LIPVGVWVGEKPQQFHGKIHKCGCKRDRLRVFY
jgi:hypothetical protein